MGINRFLENNGHRGPNFINRADIFITSKLGPADLGFESTIKAIEKSLRNLQADVIDLYLIHWPAKSRTNPTSPENKKSRAESWQAMERLYREGKLRAIGVSNYTLRHLQEMKEYATIRPAVLQNEFHPYLYDSSLLEYCRSEGIQLESYASLGEGALIKDGLVQDIAHKYARTPAQVLLRWGLQHGTVVIPKSCKRPHIEENIGCFDFQLKHEDMESLDRLSLNRMKHFCWDPNKVT